MGFWLLCFAVAAAVSVLSVLRPRASGIGARNRAERLVISVKKRPFSVQECAKGKVFKPAIFGV